MIVVPHGGDDHVVVKAVDRYDHCCATWWPLLIFPCTIKSRSSLLALAHPGGPGKGP